jgi:formate/nitrite transporter FocA (FNT family)
MAGRKFSLAAAVSLAARTSPAPLVRVSLCARGALVGARALALAFTLCFLTGSDLCTSGLALEDAFASFRLVRREPERLVDGFLR